MVAYKHINKIIIAVMAAAVALCFLAIGYSDKLNEMFGGTGVRMEYESELFDTDEIIEIDIKMDEDTWNEMLANAMSEEYYVCDVVINGKRVNNVAIRPKGNTSLSAIAMDPDSNRFSLKLEFDHFVDGQTCYGLDKLILNNNYADATNMKEAIIYDMFQYIGAEASLYNYAKVSVNGEYWGVYLALEGVEQSFMLRNFGTQDGELYKPDSMEMGGGDDDSSSGSSGFGGMTPPSGGGNFPSGKEGSDGSGKGRENRRPSSGSGGMTPPSEGDGSDSESPASEGSSGSGFSFDPDSIPEGNDFSFDPSSMPEGSDFSFDPNSIPSGSDFSFDSENMPDMSSSRPSGMGGGFSMGRDGADLNYTDDDLDSYSLIWEGSVTKTGKSDHKKVVTALKNISTGTDLETYLDVDNVLKYMAVHTFSVNMDSLSGSMAHNYYLYEYDGQLNIFPWDYNLSLGGMSMGSSGDATETINDAIDTPFSGTKFFDALLENEEYLARYHEYLQQLVDEYINGGRFDEVYSRIRSQIDSLVETDPTAFYSYDEYTEAAEILYETVKLRGESIKGQLDGTIPSTDAGQRQDKSSLVDASHLDLKKMGQFSMGGFSSKSDDDSEGGFSFGDFDFSSLAESFGQGGFSFGNMPSMEDMPQPGSGEMPADGSESSDSSGRKRPSSFSGMPGQSSAQSAVTKLAGYGICLILMIAALFITSRIRKR